MAVKAKAAIYTCVCCLFETYDPLYLRRVETNWQSGGRVREVPMCGYCALATNTQRDARHAVAVEARDEAEADAMQARLTSAMMADLDFTPLEA